MTGLAYHCKSFSGLPISFAVLSLTVRYLLGVHAHVLSGALDELQRVHGEPYVLEKRVDDVDHAVRRLDVRHHYLGAVDVKSLQTQ